MRTRAILLTVCFFAGVGLLSSPSGYAQEKKTESEGLKVAGQLTKDDPLDKVQKNSYCKVHTFKMTAGRAYRIDLRSGEGKSGDAASPQLPQIPAFFPTFLRLEDPSGKQVAADDDGGEGVASRLVYKAKQSGEYRVIVTSSEEKATGKYALAIGEASAADLLEARAKTILESPPTERKQILADLEKHLTGKKDKLTLTDVQLVFQVTTTLEFGDRELAAAAYASFASILAGASDREVAESAKMLEGASRRLNLPGREMEVKGTTVEGKPLDWKSYRGKVVLVDFWAIWCRPCRAEIPNLKKMYETYHERGFDVVGISLDNDRDTLVKFLEKEKLPWVCLHEKESKNGLHPLANYYGVFGIPQAILVDREGRVLSLDARGPDLGRLLEKHLGAADKGGAK